MNDTCEDQLDKLISEFKSKAVFIATIIFLKNNANREYIKISYSANQWFKSYFAENNLFSAIIENAGEVLIGLIDASLCNLNEVELIDIPTLYESLLGIESGNESYETRVSTEKNYRNRTMLPCTLKRY